jgi:hypothetical protein
MIPVVYPGPPPILDLGTPPVGFAVLVLYRILNHDLRLHNILHVPQATKILLSTHHLAKGNHSFLEYWPNDFFN